MLKSIFYARFHQERGSTVLHQVPEGSIIPCPPSPTAQTPFFDFSSISDYIIPRREFCDRLVSICSNHYRILGYPVCIQDQKYDRNEFIFNFCLVLDEDAQYSSYASVVRKLAQLFRNLEEQSGFLSKEEEMEGLIVAGEEGYGGMEGARVYAVCEMILEDLNNYQECMIPIDESNTLNLKLFPTRPPPPPVHSWHVPLSLVRFSSLQISTWDLTVQRIIPHINGIHSVARIATLADTDVSLTRRALTHLLYYGCILLLDVFSFAAIYAPTAEIGVFIADEGMQDECRRYINTPFSPFGNSPEQQLHQSPRKSRQQSRGATFPPPSTQVEPPSRSTVIDLYCSLRQGLALREWCLAHSAHLGNIDVRRFITFAVIKGFLYRVHRYALGTKPSVQEFTDLDDPVQAARAQERAWRKAAMSSGWQTPSHLEDQLRGRNGYIPDGDGLGGDATPGGELNLERYLDGMHCLDEICTDYKMSEREAVRRLKSVGDVVFIHR